MTDLQPEILTIDVSDTTIGAIRWGGRPDAPVAIALHGITANAWSWAAVARHVAGRATLVAVDLRGRGTSHDAPGPFGMRTHADDVAAVAAFLDVPRVVIAGHSMGAYVALTVAHRHPDLVHRLVLVDGGPPLTVPDGVAPEQAIDAIVGPAIARLDRSWPDRVAYRTMWAAHPAFAAGLTDEIERYLLSDLVPTDDGFRSCVDAAAVRFDGTELVVDAELRSQLDRLDRSATVVRATHGLMDEPPPFVAAEWIERLPQHDWRTVPDTNHYTVLVGERGAAAVAGAIVDAATTSG